MILVIVPLSHDAKYVAVSAISNDMGGDKVDAGHVRVYSYDGSGYVQLGSDIDGSEGRLVDTMLETYQGLALQ